MPETMPETMPDWRADRIGEMIANGFLVFLFAMFAYGYVVAPILLG